MPRKPQTSLSTLQIEGMIYLIRGQRVMLDSDLALLYEVPTRVLNQAVDRNKERFPADFAFTLTQPEFANLKSQIVTSSSGHAQGSSGTIAWQVWLPSP